MRTTQLPALFAAVAVLAVAACEAREETPAMDQQQPPATTTTPPAATGTPMAADLPPGVTQEMVARGEQVFRGNGNCFTCHGQNGEGTPLAPSMRDQQWLNTDGSYDGIVNVIRTGVPQPREHPAPMPPMGGAQLSEADIRAAAAYVYAISRGG